MHINDIKLYEIDGKTIFEIRGADGGVSQLYISYWTADVDGKWYKYGMEFNHDITLSDYLSGLRLGREIFIQQLLKVSEATEPEEFDIDGGDLGRGHKVGV